MQKKLSQSEIETIEDYLNEKYFIDLINSVEFDTTVIIDITSCNGWNYGSISNSMQMRLLGSSGSSSYFEVNKYGQLPILGETLSFEQGLISTDIGELYSIQLSVDDSLGYCIKSIQISYNNNVYIFDSDGYFGSGLILANECKYSYRYLTNDLPLIKCHIGELDLNVYSERGIYSLELHSCIGEENGISAQNMKDNVYVSIMGKK